MSPTRESALAGRRVLDLSVGTASYCGKLFADMGADVVKVEPPGGDPGRKVPPFCGDLSGPDSSFYFLYMNTSKRGVTLDLSKPPGAELLRRLAAGAELLVESHPPGHLGGFGLDYESIAGDNPSLVYTSITGFGQTGPHRDMRSTDLVASALGGAMHVTGAPEDPPVRLAGEQADVMASAYAAAASMIALYHAALTGRGQHVDISAQETTVSTTHVCGVGKWRDDGIVPTRYGTGLFASVPSGAYPCKDGLVYLMVNRPLHWKALAAWIHEVTGNREVLDPMFEGPSSNRQEHRELIDLYIGELTARLTVTEAYHEGQRRHIALTPVNSVRAVVADAHLASRDYFVDVERAGEVLRYPGAPYRPAATPWSIARPAPRVGEHNHEVYCGELGLSEDELAALAAEGVV